MGRRLSMPIADNNIALGMLTALTSVNSVERQLHMKGLFIVCSPGTDKQTVSATEVDQVALRKRRYVKTGI